jgi:short-subunit dehydrogenase
MTSRVVLVTGASSGIGEATARRYGASGAHVLLLARNADRLDEAVRAIRKEGGTATAYPVDLADPKAIEESSARMTREAGIPDVLINNAGAGRWLPIIETSAEEALAMRSAPR